MGAFSSHPLIELGDAVKIKDPETLVKVLSSWYEGAYMGGTNPYVATVLPKELKVLSRAVLGKDYQDTNLFRFCYLKRSEVERMNEAVQDGAQVTIRTAVKSVQSWTDSRQNAEYFAENLMQSGQEAKPDDDAQVSVIVEALIPGKDVLLKTLDLYDWLSAEPQSNAQGSYDSGGYSDFVDPKTFEDRLTQGGQDLKVWKPLYKSLDILQGTLGDMLFENEWIVYQHGAKSQVVGWWVDTAPDETRHKWSKLAAEHGEDWERHLNVICRWYYGIYMWSLDQHEVIEAFRYFQPNLKPLQVYRFCFVSPEDLAQLRGHAVQASVRTSREGQIVQSWTWDLKKAKAIGDNKYKEGLVPVIVGMVPPPGAMVGTTYGLMESVRAKLGDKIDKRPEPDMFDRKLPPGYFQDDVTKEGGNWAMPTWAEILTRALVMFEDEKEVMVHLPTTTTGLNYFSVGHEALPGGAIYSPKTVWETGLGEEPKQSLLSRLGGLLSRNPL